MAPTICVTLATSDTVTARTSRTERTILIEAMAYHVLDFGV